MTKKIGMVVREINVGKDPTSPVPVHVGTIPIHKNHVDVGIVPVHKNHINAGTVPIPENHIDVEIVPILESRVNSRTIHIHVDMLIGVWIPRGVTTQQRCYGCYELRFTNSHSIAILGRH